MSVQDLFSGKTLSISKFFQIDAESRSITPPADFQHFGVESDENATRIKFECPQIVGDSIDLTTLSLRINYKNANGDLDQYVVTDVESDGTTIYFSWLLSRKCTLYKGTVSFVVCAVKTNAENEITIEWNTSICRVDVLEGLEVDNPEVAENVSDLINQLLGIVNTSVESVRSAAVQGVENVNTAKSEAVSAIATEKGNAVQAVTDASSEKIQAIGDVAAQAQQAINTTGDDALDSITKTAQTALNSMDEKTTSFDEKAEQAQSDIEEKGNAVVQEIEGAQKELLDFQSEFANTLKATASGEVIRVDDVSPIEHTAKVKVGGKNLNIDPLTVTVTRYGKNILNLDNLCNDRLVNVGNNVYKFTMGEETSDRFTNVAPICAPKGTTLYISCKFTDYTVTNKTLYMILTFADGTQSFPDVVLTSTGRELNINNDLRSIQFYMIGEEAGAYIEFKHFQIEIGNVATDYELYSAKTYTPNADGTVDVVSVSPTMTLLTDTAGAIIDVEYNQDTNAFKDNVHTDIKTLDNDMSTLKNNMGDTETALDTIIAEQEAIIAQQESIIAIQNALIGGETA